MSPIDPAVAESLAAAGLDDLRHQSQMPTTITFPTPMERRRTVAEARLQKLQIERELDASSDPIARASLADRLIDARATWKAAILRANAAKQMTTLAIAERFKIAFA